MKSFGGTKTHIIQQTDPVQICNELQARGIETAHFNNGTFNLPKDKFAPAFLAAFKRVMDILQDTQTPLIVAINSDKSMYESYVDKEDEQERLKNHISKNLRAENVASVLSALFPDRQIAIIFYDQQTPHELYESLSRSGFGMESLHKVGFGTSPDDKPIIGAKFFKWVYACPLPFDAKPIMYADTRDVNALDRQPDLVEKLTDVNGPHGRPYITTGGKLLFPLPNALMQYGDQTRSGGMRLKHP